MKKKIPSGEKLSVKLTTSEFNLIQDETFCDPGFLEFAVANTEGVRFDWSLDEIEDIQGFIATKANHTSSPELEKKLNRLSDKLQEYLDAYDDQDE